MSTETNTDLNIRTDSLEDRTGVSNTDLRIGQYEFFADKGESRYVTAAAGGQARLSELREEIFTSSFPRQTDVYSGAGQVQEMSILETAPEYTQGLYDEANTADKADTLLVLLFAGICILTFFITRGFYGYKRRKADECTSQSR
jgi:hypothetical protein